MDWDKAKKIIIVMLLILNGALFIANYYYNDRYELTQSRERAIYQVLSARGITLYTDIVYQAPPMRQISVKIPSMSVNELKEMFFTDKEEVQVTMEFNKTILSAGTRSVSLENNVVTFTDNTNQKKFEKLTESQAIMQADDFISSLGKRFEDYKFDNLIQTEDGFIVEYIRLFHGEKMFHTVCRVAVTNRGVVQAETGFYEEESFFGEKREICMPDEALLTFIREISKEETEEGLFINKMEIGYDFQEKMDVAEGRQLRLVPCYRIYTSYRPEPYIINAYTNEMKES
ncbi:MAG: hypothetical protein KHZ62_11160 [Clostridiales bacterium]|nr:hypothetical protein [Clostridiales bacterium]